MNNGARAANAGHAHSNGLMDNVSSFGNDVATLASLQSKLAAADARETLSRSTPALYGLALALLLAIAGTVAIVVGLALWIAEHFAMQASVALMMTGLGSLAVVAILGVVSVRLIGSSVTTFRRSAEELERNVAWIKTTLTHSGR